MEIKADSSKVLDLLGQDRLYQVPIFQRSYSWKESQTAELFEDILAIIGKENKHFIGSMVFVAPESGNRTRIIDGQQRLATIVLMLCALKHVLKNKESKISTAKDRIKSIDDMIRAQDPVTLDRDIRLELNREDKDLLKNIILEDKFIQEQHISISHKLIKNAYDYFVEKLNEKIKEGSEVFIQNFMDAILHKLLFVRIEVDNYSAAFELFETLNFSGLKLSAADLVKNHLLSINNENVTDIAETWEKITDDVEEYGVTKFLRHFWSSKYDLIRKENLFKVIRNTIVKQNLEKFMEEFSTEADVYDNLRKPDHGFWNDPKIEKTLQDIKLLRVEQIYVILLAVYSKFYKDEKNKFIKILNALVNLSFRYNTICQSNPNKLESEYSEMAIGIRDGSVGFDELYDKIKKLEPSKDDFIKAFDNFETKTAELAKYILIRINDDMMSENGNLQEFEENEQVNLEHIIPKKPNAEWKKFFENKNIDYTTLNHKIGNMTLLLGTWNSRLKNNFFTKKVEEYKESKLPLNEDLKRLTEFGITEVTKRQKMIGMRAEKLWKIQ